MLKDDGWVYAETPFIQQVHLQRYDYTRFTHLGHRRLFRHFVQVDSGAVCGPGMALAWTYRAFLFSLFDPGRNLSRILLGMVADFTGFWLKYFDRYVIDIDNPNAINAASAVFFLGRKCGRAISDAELLEFFRGV